MSGRNDWRTPLWILDRVREIDSIGLDPCTSRRNPTGAYCFYAQDNGEDGASLPWSPTVTNCAGLVFVNPPFTGGLIQQFVAKIIEEADAGTEIVTLTPVDATKWRRTLAEHATSRATPWKRVNYVNPDTGKTVSGVRFPSELHYFGPRPIAFDDAFHDVAEVIRLR